MEPDFIAEPTVVLERKEGEKLAQRHQTTAKLLFENLITETAVEYNKADTVPGAVPQFSYKIDAFGGRLVYRFGVVTTFPQPAAVP
jgi:hypothetical protein